MVMTGEAVKNDRLNTPVERLGGGKSTEQKANFVRTVLASLIITFFILLAGCSSKNNRNAAKETIDKALLRESMALPIHLGRLDSGACGDTPGSVKDLFAQIRYYSAQKAGLVTITPDGPGFWKVELLDAKPKLLEALKKSKRNQTGGCDFISFGFQIAKKSVVDIVSFHEITSEKSEVEFTWNWELTPWGTKLLNSLNENERTQLNADIQNGLLVPVPSFNLVDMTQSSAPHPGKMTLKKSGDGWILDE